MVPLCALLREAGHILSGRGKREKGKKKMVAKTGRREVSIFLIS